MTLPQVEPTDQVIGGWIVHAHALGGNYTHRAAALTAAYDNIGPKGMVIMLKKMKLETALDVVQWMNAK